MVADIGGVGRPAPNAGMAAWPGDDCPGPFSAGGPLVESPQTATGDLSPQRSSRPSPFVPTWVFETMYGRETGGGGARAPLASRKHLRSCRASRTGGGTTLVMVTLRQPKSGTNTNPPCEPAPDLRAGSAAGTSSAGTSSEERRTKQPRSDKNPGTRLRYDRDVVESERSGSARTRRTRCTRIKSKHHPR